MKKTCALIVAAGNSSRMNFPKPLLQWQEQTLLEFQINQLTMLPFSEIIVVLGHKAETIINQVSIADSRVSLLACPTYQKGLSSSLKFGLEYASETHDAVLLMLVDLPLIQLKTIKQVFEAGATFLHRFCEPFAIQPRYEYQKGHPVFIGYFQELNWRDLHGDIGAKPLIGQLKNREFIDTNDVGVIFDIDTPQDYEKALSIYKRRTGNPKN
ncbi:NTP transferase domain-containing protein [Neobacillus sp. NPDC093127]|uniref:nucleotidyltransferase family protein n=1 Tax=Neobacillus sp. NPDC093127 TaxID=3364296 RepID=UPI0038297653